MGDLVVALVGPLGLWSASLLYGMNIIFYFTCLKVLIKPRHPGDKIPWILLAGITIQFMLSTIHMVLILGASLNAFLTVPPTATAQALILKWKSIFVVYTEAQQLVYGLNNLFGDLILVWRLYKVFGENIYICILPLLLSFGSVSVGLYCTTFIFIRPDDLKHGTQTALENAVTANFIMLAVTQLLITGLLGGKIFWSSRNVNARRYMNIVWMLVESGALLATVDLVYLIVWRLNYNGFSQFWLCILGQLTGLVPLTIIVRVGLGLAMNGKTTQKASTIVWNRKTVGTTSTAVSAFSNFETDTMEMGQQRKKFEEVV